MLLRAELRTESGATIVEAIVAAACLITFFVGLFAISSKTLLLLRATGQQAAATFCVEQRVEEIRRLTWAQLTDGAYLRDNVFNSVPGAASTVPGLSERLTISEYPTASTSTVVVRTAAGAASVQSSNTALANAKMLRIKTLISWPGSGGSSNSREFTTVVTQGGILR